MWVVDRGMEWEFCYNRGPDCDFLTERRPFCPGGEGEHNFRVARFEWSETDAGFQCEAGYDTDHDWWPFPTDGAQDVEGCSLCWVQRPAQDGPVR